MVVVKKKLPTSRLVQGKVPRRLNNIAARPCLDPRLVFFDVIRDSPKIRTRCNGDLGLLSSLMPSIHNSPSDDED